MSIARNRPGRQFYDIDIESGTEKGAWTIDVVGVLGIDERDGETAVSERRAADFRMAKTDGDQGDARRRDLVAIIASVGLSIRAPELHAVEGVVLRLLKEWTAADRLIAAAAAPRQQAVARELT